MASVAGALLELGIGFFGVLVTMGLPVMDRWYASMAHGAGAGLGFRALIAVICLLPPTVLMGATLPAISRWIEHAAACHGSTMGQYRGGGGRMPAGGILSAPDLFDGRCVLCRGHDQCGRGINRAIGFVGGGVYADGSKKDRDARLAAYARGNTPRDKHLHGDWLLRHGGAGGGGDLDAAALIAFGGDGLHLFDHSGGVFGGAGDWKQYRRNVDALRNQYSYRTGFCQILCGGNCVVGLCGNHPLPPRPIDKDLVWAHGHLFIVDLARCAWAILPATLFWGASFPLALAANVSGKVADGDPARAVGRVYAANTVGAIVGALFFALIAVRMWGSQSSEHLLIGLAGLAAFVTVIPGFMPTAAMAAGKKFRRLAGTGSLLVCAISAPIVGIEILSHDHLDTVPWQLIAWGRDTPNRMNDSAWSVVAMGEGVNSSVAVTTDGQDQFFHVAGKVEASTIPLDMRLQMMLGHFPSLFHADAGKRKKVLIVGCGAGVTAGSFVLYPHEKIVLCEMEPLVPQMAAHFAEQNNDVVTINEHGTYLDPAVQVVFDDARHYVLTTDEKFDIITSDPIHPWVKGAACLYTQEYFESVKARLNKGGIVTQWVPLYESDIEVVKSEIKTFFEVFPNGTIWTNMDDGGGYDVILMGSVEPMVIDAATLRARVDESPLISGILKNVELGMPLKRF